MELGKKIKNLWYRGVAKFDAISVMFTSDSYMVTGLNYDRKNSNEIDVRSIASLSYKDDEEKLIHLSSLRTCINQDLECRIKEILEQRSKEKEKNKISSADDVVNHVKDMLNGKNSN